MTILRLGVAICAALLLVGIAALRPTPASACIGGMDFRWALEHASGWIAEATVIEATAQDGGFAYRLRLSDVETVRGRVPDLRRVDIAMGAICDQVPHHGERLLILRSVKGSNASYATPIAYVIEGADATPKGDVAAALALLPATDTQPRETGQRPNDEAVIVALLGLAGFAVALRRTSDRGRAQVGSTRSLPHR